MYMQKEYDLLMQAKMVQNLDFEIKLSDCNQQLLENEWFSLFNIEPMMVDVYEENIRQWVVKHDKKLCNLINNYIDKCKLVNLFIIMFTMILFIPVVLLFIKKQQVEPEMCVYMFS